MHNSLYILLIGCLSTQLCHAQNDTGYYNLSWLKTTKDKAVHFCTFNKEDDLYAVKCYYTKNGIRSLSGYSIYKDSLVLEGYADYFNLEGKKNIDAFFQSNIPSGIWEYYYDSTGTKWHTNSYKYGKIYEINSYYENGKLKRHEIHDTTDTKIVTGKCYNEAGEEIPFTPFETPPIKPYDVQQFIARTMHYPANARENGISGRVIMAFTVNPDGSISDLELVHSVSLELDAEALRVVSLMPPWKPGKKDGENVKVRFTLPITFKLE